MLKSPAEFAAELLTMNGGDKIEAITSLIIAARDGSLRYMPADWIEHTVRWITGEVVAAPQVSNYDEKGNWIGEVRNENGWTP